MADRAKRKSPARNAAEHGAKSEKKPAKRSGAGRPSRLSREMIIDTSMKLLEQYSIEGFTLAKVAEELDTVSMALYNYFPSREALLAELSNHICKQFEMPTTPADQAWQRTLEDWVATLRTLAARYPIMIKVTGIDGKTSSGWLRIARIVSTTLQQAGFEGRALAINSWLFTCEAIALVNAELMGGFHSPIAFTQLDELAREDQEHYLMLRPYHEQLSAQAILDEGLADMIATLERKLDAP